MVPTTGVIIGVYTTLTLEQTPPLVDDWAEAALKVNKIAIVLGHPRGRRIRDVANHLFKTGR